MKKNKAKAEEHVLNLLGYGYLWINKKILCLLGPEKSIFLSQLIEVEADVKKTIEFEAQRGEKLFIPGEEPVGDFFYYSKGKMKNETGLTYKQQDKICTELEKLDLIETGFKEPELILKYCKINHNKIAKILFSEDV